MSEFRVAPLAFGRDLALDRSLSWIVQRAWKTAREDIKKMPSTDP